MSRFTEKEERKIIKYLDKSHSAIKFDSVKEFRDMQKDLIGEVVMESWLAYSTVRCCYTLSDLKVIDMRVSKDSKIITELFPIGFPLGPEIKTIPYTRFDFILGDNTGNLSAYARTDSFSDSYLADLKYCEKDDRVDINGVLNEGFQIGRIINREYRKRYSIPQTDFNKETNLVSWKELISKSLKPTPI